jgi:hypothetical protein
MSTADYSFRESMMNVHHHACQEHQQIFITRIHVTRAHAQTQKYGVYARRGALWSLLEPALHAAAISMIIMQKWINMQKKSKK